jgi:uncharacterized Fe-S cluster protein YjdI
MEKIHEFKKDRLTVIWKPERCQHAGICVKMLPQVYRPGQRPWIQAENASVEELKAQIGSCPSGALSYRMED